MKRGVRIAKSAGKNIGMTVLLIGVIFVLKILRTPGLDKDMINSLAEIYFTISMLFAAGLLFPICIANAYSLGELIKVSMGYTRKKVFMDMQLVKIAASAGIVFLADIFPRTLFKTSNQSWILWSFGILMLIQAFAEFAAVFYLKYKKMGIFLLIIGSAAIGFLFSYATMKFIKTGFFHIEFSFAYFQEHVWVWGILLAVLYHILLILSWSLWRKLEIRL